MGKIKITKKDLKEDEVQHFGMNVVTYIKENYTILVIILALIVVGFIGVRLYKYRQSIVMQESNKLFTVAINYYERAVMAEQEPQRRQDYLNECIKTCEQILRDYPGAKVSRVALFFEANAYYLLNDFDQAITLYQQYVESATNDLDEARGHISLGYCFENKFFYERTDQNILDQARREYERAIDLAGDSYLAYEGMLCKARLLELAGKKQEAIALYEKVMDDREFVMKDFEQRVAALEERPQEELSIEQRIVKQVNSALKIFTFYRSAEMELTRLRGETM